MPERSSKKEPRHLNLFAASMVDEVTNEEAEATKLEAKRKNPHAVALGRLGGKKGGTARAQKLTEEQRKAIARRAAEARWSARKK
jgi:hypothetical protein